VAEYRAYTIGHDGHFVSFEGFTARDDDDAIAAAQRLATDRDIELWSGDRFIVRLDRKKPHQSERY